MRTRCLFDHGRRFFVSVSPRTHWAIQGVALIGITLWIASDVDFQLAAGGMGDFETSGMRSHLLLSALALIGLHLLVLGTSLLVGQASFRSIRSMLIFTTIMSLWIGLYCSQNEIAFHGKGVRMRAQLEHLRRVCQQLQKDWPDEDGTLELLGPFMAYPIKRPTTLMLLTPPHLDTSGTSIAAIQRSDTGGIQFQLSTYENGQVVMHDWVEWHPDEAPRSFVGGLGEEMKLCRQNSLSKDWFLVRYAPARYHVNELVVARD